MHIGDDQRVRIVAEESVGGCNIEVNGLRPKAADVGVTEVEEVPIPAVGEQLGDFMSDFVFISLGRWGEEWALGAG